MLAAIAKMGAFINLFNLIPIWQLDGGRVFRTLTRSERWLAAAAVALLWAITEQPLLLLLVIGAVYRAVCERGSGEPDQVMPLIERVPAPRRGVPRSAHDADGQALNGLD